jgi:general secretion pathway protein K
MSSARSEHGFQGSHDKSAPTGRHPERGIALILVLWIVVILSMAALSLSLLTRTEALATLSAKEEMENKFLAEAGIRRGIMELFYRHANRNQQVLLEGSEVFQCDGRAYTAEMADGRYRIRIMDESGKINLNTLTDNNGIILKNLLMNNGVAEDTAVIIVDSILDWKDKDNLHRLHGAEDEYYQSLPRPYKAKNAAFDSLEELVFVRGITRQVLWGSADGKGILPFCTIHSTTDKINLLSAPPEVLRAIPGMTDDMIRRIVEYRDLSPTAKVQHIAAWVGADFSAIAPYVTTVESNVYSIDAIGYKVNEKRNFAIRAVTVIEGAQKYRMIYFRSPAAERS